MQLQAAHFTSIEAPEFRLAGTGHDGRHQVHVTISGDGHLFLYATAAELSELGHRLIELAAIAEEREQGVDPKWGDLSASREAAREASREAVA